MYIKATTIACKNVQDDKVNQNNRIDVYLYIKQNHFYDASLRLIKIIAQYNRLIEKKVKCAILKITNHVKNLVKAHKYQRIFHDAMHCSTY